ncbi:MAG TPA: ATP-binding protein [Thermoanaerobaculia bacterium]|jgi:signal transduction histidine kinase|nr:ATP-binding protein [Thermoanaerobaculia bacterium]
MTPKPQTRDRRSIWRVGPESTWTTVLPVTFIIVSLLSLVILPLAVARHTAKMRNEITRVAEPARRSANQIQIDLSNELDKIIAWQVTGQANYRNDYYRLVAEEDAFRRQVMVLGPKLSDEVSQQLDLLFAQTARWHQGVREGQLVDQPLPKEVFLTRLYERHPAYEKSLLAASDLEIAIQSGIEERLQKIRSAEQLNVSLTIILTLLALTSALLVAGLGRQMRLLAREAMRRRQEAEREAADAKSARAAAEREERRAAFLASAGQELAASLDYEQTIAMLAKLIVPNLAEAVVIDMATEEGGMRRAAAAHHDARFREALEETIGQPLAEMPEAIVRVMQTREAKLVGGSALEAYMNGSANRATVAVPLVSRGQTLGILIAASPEGKPFQTDDASLLGELGRHGSLAIDNARLYLESQQAVRAREEVLAIVSHDLRNPLSAVILGSSLLATSQNLTEEEKEQLETIDMSARRMNRLIADLLDVTRLEGGKQLPVEPARVEVEALFREMYELFKVQAATNQITFQYQVGDGVSGVHADRHRILQVLQNLIGNSMKFTPADGVIAFRADAREGNEVLFTVSDSGPGIPAENLADIFNPYWQAKRAERLGAGLGLPIAKGIVEAHGGRIWVDSQPGVGTKFHFTLQREVAEVEAAPVSS